MTSRKTWISRILMILTLAALIPLLTACPSSDSDWVGPIVLDQHAFYLDQLSGKVVVVDVQKNNVARFELSTETDEDNPSWRFVASFIDNSHLIFVSEDTQTYYILSDDTGRIEWTIPQLPLEFNSFAFSADGRWMAAYQGSGEWQSDYYYDDYYYNEYYGSDYAYTNTYKPWQYGSPTATININAHYYGFKSQQSVVSNPNAILLLDRESGEHAFASLKKNDQTIRSIHFTGPFAICQSGDSCNDSDAATIERLVAFGSSRMWLLDPEAGADAQADVIPLSVNESENLNPVSLASSANLEDFATDGIDDRETLFVRLSSSRDLISISMHWNKTEEALEYNINKLGLPFVLTDMHPYLDHDELYVFAVSGDDLAASVQLSSANIQTLALPDGASLIRPMEIDDTEIVALYGDSSLMLVTLADLDVFGEKNVQQADLGFIPNDFAFVDGDSPLVIALNLGGRDLTTVDLGELMKSDLNANVLQLTEYFEDYVVDDHSATLYLLGDYDSDEDEQTYHTLSLSGDLTEEQAEFKGDASQLHLMKDKNGETSHLLFNFGNKREELLVVSTEGGNEHRFEHLF